MLACAFSPPSTTTVLLGREWRRRLSSVTSIWRCSISSLYLRTTDRKIFSQAAPMRSLHWRAAETQRHIQLYLPQIKYCHFNKGSFTPSVTKITSANLSKLKRGPVCGINGTHLKPINMLTNLKESDSFHPWIQPIFSIERVCPSQCYVASKVGSKFTLQNRRWSWFMLDDDTGSDDNVWAKGW